MPYAVIALLAVAAIVLTWIYCKAFGGVVLAPSVKG